ncbi:hypothetical protein ATY41_00015 [Leifsonia xyli subsp. xyli]|uniref:Uncharacterized protein n=1 Tax=Leifsonia xyli subsp. xyli TaxID=59736 RepID=A0A1E2SMR2_LEIXY|nr:hypothetical protein ATY41_00015 [Leifsonia xyli subsp. xyli]
MREYGWATAAASSAEQTPVPSLSERQPHLHGLGHLAFGRRPRCGCGSESLADERYEIRVATEPSPTWVPLRHQRTGWCRTHFVYSDRMPLLSR